jgi:hypothetical protein
MEAIPTPPALPATTDDLQQLKLLSIFHYVVAGVTALFSLFPVIHLVMGLAIVTGHIPMESSNGEAAPMDPRLFGWLFVGFAALFIVGGLTLAGFMAYAGRCIARRRRHLLCLVVAGISCMLMPFGTVLGVFTLVVLLRPQVRALFTPAAAP